MSNPTSVRFCNLLLNLYRNPPGKSGVHTPLGILGNDYIDYGWQAALGEVVSEILKLDDFTGKLSDKHLSSLTYLYLSLFDTLQQLFDSMSDHCLMPHEADNPKFVAHQKAKDLLATHKTLYDFLQSRGSKTKTNPVEKVSNCESIDTYSSGPIVAICNNCLINPARIGKNPSGREYYYDCADCERRSNSIDSELSIGVCSTEQGCGCERKDQPHESFLETSTRLKEDAMSLSAKVIMSASMKEKPTTVIDVIEGREPCPT